MAEEEQELRVVLLGKTGAGKSSLGNTLLGQDIFRVERGMGSGTQKCQWADVRRKGVLLQVTDTPGLFDTKKTEQEVLLEIGKSVATASPGPHVIIFVIRADRPFTQEEHDAYLTMKKMFGDDFGRFMILAFVAVDQLLGPDATKEQQQTELDQQIAGAPETLHSILSEASNRYCGINNEASRDERNRQGIHLFSMVQELSRRNGGVFLSSKLCEEVNALVEALVQERMAKERLNHTRAAEGTKKDIVDEVVKPDVFDKIIAIIRKVGECVGAFAGGFLKGANPGKCSVM